MRTNLKILSLIVAILILAAVTGKSDPLGDDPGLPDSVMVDSVSVNSVIGEAVIPITFENDQDLSALEIVLTHNSADLAIDSFSFVDGRVENLSIKSYEVTDNNIWIYAIVGGEPVIAPGIGLFGNLHVSFLPSSDPQLVNIDTVTIINGDIEHFTSFSDVTSNNFLPQFQVGYLEIQNSGCCINMVTLITMLKIMSILLI